MHLVELVHLISFVQNARKQKIGYSKETSLSQTTAEDYSPKSSK